MSKASFIINFLEKRLRVTLSAKNRDNEHVFARALYFKLADMYSGMSIEKQAKMVNRHHASAIHSRKNVIEHVLTIPMYRDVFSDACDILEHMDLIPEEAIDMKADAEFKSSIEKLEEVLSLKKKRIAELELEPHEIAYRNLNGVKRVEFRKRVNAMLKML